MPATLLLSAAIASFGPPVTESELARAHIDTRAPRPVELSYQPARWSAFGSAPTIAEQIDAWWAEDGLALIAEAVRPTPTLPAGLDLAALAAGRIDLRITLTRSSQ